MDKKIKVTVRLFSHARYIFEKDELELVLPIDASVSEAISALKAMGGENFKHVPFRMACNHKFAVDTDIIHDGDELACIPPVQGG